MACGMGNVSCPGKDLGGKMVVKVSVSGVTRWWYFRLIPGIVLLRLGCFVAGFSEPEIKIK